MIDLQRPIQSENVPEQVAEVLFDLGMLCSFGAKQSVINTVQIPRCVSIKGSLSGE